jgi:SNF2 family DNA or RNA helicase
MIIKEINNKETVLFEPEDSREAKYLESFPGLLRDGRYFFSPCKARVIYNLYTRISKYIKPTNIKYTVYIQSLIKDSFPSKEIPSTFKYHTKPLIHQEVALRFMYNEGSCGLLLDPGLGKTKVVLDYIFLMKFKKVIIVCPKPLLYVWEEEILTHRPELSCYIVQSTDFESEREEIGKAQVVVLNYNKAVTLEESLIKLGAEFLALDEGLIKDYTTDRTKSLTKLGTKITHKCVMSGTLINNSPLDSFAPIRFVQPALVGTGVTRFKDRYAIVARQNRNIVLGFRDMPEIQTIIASSCIVMRKEEWLKDLPPKVFHIVKCALTGESLEAYNSLVSNWMFEYGGESFEFDNALPRLGKLLQIANGFVYSKTDDEDPLEELEQEIIKKKAKRKTLFFKEQPKIQAFDELINDPTRLHNRRSIVWFNFQAELEILEKYLINKGIKFLTVKGGGKNVGEKIKLFNSDPSYRFLLGQARTINYGATILGKKRKEDEEYFIKLTEFSTTVSDQIFYSLNFSLEVFLQQQDRIHRIGQTLECHYWIILTNSCVESKVYKTMEDKVFINRSLLIDFSKEVTILK